MNSYGAPPCVPAVTKEQDQHQNFSEMRLKFD